jgi:hypothetical protein
MEQRQPSSLPYRARGIEVGELAIEFLEDKVIVIPKGRNEHYTLELGVSSGVIDIHCTSTNPASPGRRTLFAIRLEDVLALLSEIGPSMLPAMLGLSRPLRLGWLARNQIGIARVPDATSEQDMAAVARLRKKRLVLDDEKFANNTYVPEYLGAVWDFPDGPFLLGKQGRLIGIGIKKTYQGRKRLYWLKSRDINRFFREMEPKFIEAALRYAISPQKYIDYREYGLTNS